MGEDKAAVDIAGASAIYRYDHCQMGGNNFQTAVSQAPLLPVRAVFHHYGPSGTASAGTTTTITTGLTLNRSISGYKLRITSYAAAGSERTILSNTYGANSVITVAWHSRLL